MKLWITKKLFDGKPSYSTTIKSKDKDQNEIKYYLPISFMKVEEPNENCEIEIKDGFYGCFNSKDGIKPKLIIKAYTVERLSEYNTTANTPNDVQTSQNDPYEAFGNEIELTDDDLPF